jgi:hypothetical protein
MSLMPWTELIAAAAQIGVPPTAFWALSVREWRALMGEAQALDGSRLGELIAAFPDDCAGLSTPHAPTPSPKGGKGGA